MTTSKSISLFLIILMMISAAIVSSHTRQQAETVATESSPAITTESKTETTTETSSVVYILSTTETIITETVSETELETASTTIQNSYGFVVEYELIASVVMNEAGYESYEGQIAVAQCIKNACIRENKPFSSIRGMYGYTRSKKPNNSVFSAVYDVFENGATVTDEPILFYYNPDYGYSSFHESQVYVMTIGGHRFFKLRQ